MNQTSTGIVVTDPGGKRGGRVCVSLLLVVGIYAGLVAGVASYLMRVLPKSPDIAPVQITQLYVAMCLHGVVAAGALIGCLLLRRRRAQAERMAGAALAFSIIFGVVTLDLILGFFYPPPDRLDPVVQPHSTRGWSHRPNAIGSYFGIEVRINSHGLREREFPRRKPEDEFRVMFLGDSIAVGVGLAVEDTFVRQVEPLLQARSASLSIRTINAGCNGYTTWQETAYLREEGLGLSPDLVVLCFCINDVGDVMDAPPKRLRGVPLVTEYPPLNHVSGIARMSAYYWDARRAKKIREEHLWTHQNIYGAPIDEWVRVVDLFEDPPSERLAAAWERTFEDLEELDAVCREAGIPWVLLSFPVAFNLPADRGARAIIERLSDWARERDVPALDFTAAFESWMAENDADASTLFFDNIHPGEQGSRVIAESLDLFLAERGLLRR